MLTYLIDYMHDKICLEKMAERYDLPSRPLHVIFYTGKNNQTKNKIQPHGEVSQPKIRGKSLMLHPDYEEEGKINDIAFLFLKRPVTYTDQIRPICLPSGKVTHQTCN